MFFWGQSACQHDWVFLDRQHYREEKLIPGSSDLISRGVVEDEYACAECGKRDVYIQKWEWRSEQRYPGKEEDT